MFLFLLSAFTTLLALGACDKNFTVTSEVVLEVEVKNYNGQGDDISGQVVIGLFGDTVPVASLNFKTLCSGFKRPSSQINAGKSRKARRQQRQVGGFGDGEEVKLSYKNTYCHRLVRDMLLHCGDVFGTDGHGGTSIYGESFNDENFIISHSSGGVVSMANRGKDTNASQFFITLGSARFLDKRHVAFGKVTKGYQYLMAINRMGPQDKDVRPKRPVRFTECNVNEVKKYELSVKDMKTDDLEGIVSL
ncbi:peptidyl-prolyl cis-trans isomerase H [Aplysia californica]|uniref:Peptidyl-prolyl cis-trans isomerase n=1 Tax=Aplysia californica TaxID=6500 RepID=A0ABM0ZY41_APLCA|nr:peptidyl-prolyl cis-trans isomerase H [Aplysia californica]